MKSTLSLAFGLAFAALVVAGCGGQQPAAPAAAQTAPAAQQPSNQPAAQAAPASNSAQPAPAVAETPQAPRMDESNSVTIKAVEPSGKSVTLTFRTIYFDFDKYTIRSDAKDAVAYNAKQLNDVPNLKITIEGHCDERGTTEYNLALGEHRAVAVMHALEGDGVAKGRLTTISYGKERPADSGHDEAAWAKNRRSIVRES